MSPWRSTTTTTVCLWKYWQEWGRKRTTENQIKLMECLRTSATEKRANLFHFREGKNVKISRGKLTDPLRKQYKMIMTGCQDRWGFSNFTVKKDFSQNRYDCLLNKKIKYNLLSAEIPRWRQKILTFFIIFPLIRIRDRKLFDPKFPEQWNYRLSVKGDLIRVGYDAGLTNQTSSVRFPSPLNFS